MKLTSKAVNELMNDCLFTTAEINNGTPDNAVIVKGVIKLFGFHPGRLETHKAEIAELLAELPDNFQANGGGGWSFLNACMDKDGNHWGEHTDIEALIALGIATNQAKYLLSRDIWESMPGGVPYFVVGVTT